MKIVGGNVIYDDIVELPSLGNLFGIAFANNFVLNGQRFAIGGHKMRASAIWIDLDLALKICDDLGFVQSHFHQIPTYVKPELRNKNIWLMVIEAQFKM